MPLLWPRRGKVELLDEAEQYGRDFGDGFEHDALPGGQVGTPPVYVNFASAQNGPILNAKLQLDLGRMPGSVLALLPDLTAVGMRPWAFGLAAAFGVAALWIAGSDDRRLGAAL